MPLVRLLGTTLSNVASINDDMKHNNDNNIINTK